MIRFRAEVLVAICIALSGCGKHLDAGTPSGERLPDAVVAARAERQAKAMQSLPPTTTANPDKQILFGDLHVHTTFSADAFVRSLPMLQGEGVHPPADACDFARYCSDLDFWSINDHAEAISPAHWQETKDAIRQCNAIAGDPKNPDVVAFLGWEWTQVGMTRDDHYGHKNVIFREIEEDRVPTRPISALSEQLVGALRRPAPLSQRIQMPMMDWANRQSYFDFGEYQNELAKLEICPKGVDVRKLPVECSESADTPKELFEKLAQWGFDSIVIPHGTTWGFYTPPGTTWDKQLTKGQHDPERQTLIEVYSGHGNSEEYRDWKDIDWDAKGNPVCPEPTANYEPCCWRAGEIIRARCGSVSAEICERRVREAKLNFLRGNAVGRMSIPGTDVSDWGECGQCLDCYLPSYNFRPGNSAQYILALTNFDQPESPKRFEFGFIASSDNHTARPGTGYKEYARRMMTEATGAKDEAWHERILGARTLPEPESRMIDPANLGVPAFAALDTERQSSFFMTGGLVATHATGRDRDSIWQSLKRREVYGTSGERILLWFDVLNAPEGSQPMGSSVAMASPPRFRVRAAGSFKQKPGCPEHSMKGLTKERLELLCRGECYNPSDERYRITRIEVVRIRPQKIGGEPVKELIDDPWQTLPCTGGTEGCVVEFEDSDFTAGARDALYYVRAIQEPTLAVNAGGLRCKRDERGRCIEVNPCWGDFRLPFNDDCLATNEERAWSSPIFLSPRPGLVNLEGSKPVAGG